MVPRPQGVADSHIQVIRVEGIAGAGSRSGRIGTGKRRHRQHREIAPLVSSLGIICSATIPVPHVSHYQTYGVRTGDVRILSPSPAMTFVGTDAPVVM